MSATFETRRPRRGATTGLSRLRPRQTGGYCQRERRGRVQWTSATYRPRCGTAAGLRGGVVIFGVPWCRAFDSSQPSSSSRVFRQMILSVIAICPFNLLDSAVTNLICRMPHVQVCCAGQGRNACVDMLIRGTMRSLLYHLRPPPLGWNWNPSSAMPRPPPIMPASAGSRTRPRDVRVAGRATR
jgi:hypothetical protein